MPYTNEWREVTMVTLKKGHPRKNKRLKVNRDHSTYNDTENLEQITNFTRENIISKNSAYVLGGSSGCKNPQRLSLVIEMVEQLKNIQKSQLYTAKYFAFGPKTYIIRSFYNKLLCSQYKAVNCLPDLLSTGNHVWQWNAISL